MNCFNIREIQGILKRKFFTDLVNSHDHKNLLEKSMIGLRYKTNSNVNLDLDMTSFYNFGIHATKNNMNVSYNNSNINSNLPFLHNVFNKSEFFLINLFFNKSFKLSYNFITDFLSIFMFFNMNSLFCFPSLHLLFNLIFSNFYFLNVNNLGTHKSIQINNTSISNKSPVDYRLDSSSLNNVSHQFIENSQNQRFNRFNSLLINYDYKTGHYIGN
jgi:hypothetical protein